MNYKKIPYVDRLVSGLVFGTATPTLLRASGKNGSDIADRREAAFRLLDSAFAAGINCFDCSAHYGEEILGDWIALRDNREQVVILSKCAHPNEWRERVTDFDILYDLHNALPRLKVEKIDIYMLHRDNPTVPVGPIVETLNRLYDEGKIGAFGGSNWRHERIEAANEYAAKHNLIPFTVSSPYFGLAEQVGNPWAGDCVSLSGRENAAARKWYADHDIPVFAYSSLARGFFSGAFASGDRDGAKAFLDEPGVKGYYCEANFERLRRTEILAEQKGCTVAQLALAWVFHQPFDVLPLVSTEKPSRIQENVQAVDIKLTPREAAWLNLEEVD